MIAESDGVVREDLDDRLEAVVERSAHPRISQASIGPIIFSGKGDIISAEEQRSG